MPRVLLLSWLVFATYSSPALAAAERAAVAVSLRVEPSCNVRIEQQDTKLPKPPAVACVSAPPPAGAGPAQPERPVYTLRTIRRGGETVNQFDF